jgi:sulfate/thiosulfate transport system permease protein
MSSAVTGTSGAAPPRPAYWPRLGGAALGRGLVTAYLSIIVLLPIAALIAQSTEGGWSAFWSAISSPEAVYSLKLTLIASLIVVAINVFAGTIIAWVLVRDNFPGKSALNAVIDLPFALPTVVAGITLLALYGPNSPIGVHAAFTKAAVVMALAFVTLPFVVRAVQPVLMELDTEMEEAAASLGAGPLTTFRRIILPSLLPAILAGSALAFARAIGEFGSLVLFSGLIAFKTEVMSGLIFQQIGNGNETGAAAQSVVLLAIALVVLLVFGRLTKWSLRHAG